MGQILTQDKIGILSESAGTITLAPSILTIGGQQFTTSSLNVAANLGAANTRYQVYAIRSGGVVSLVVSTNENSVGPAGYTSWKLVGSYYSNGLGSVAFGSFVNIEGRPSTSYIAFVPGGTHNNATYTGFWNRNGNLLTFNSYISYSATPTLVELFLSLPFSIDSGGYANNDIAARNPRIGTVELMEASFTFGELSLAGGNSIRVFRGSTNPQSVTTTTSTASFTGFNGTYQDSSGTTRTMINGSRVSAISNNIYIQGWSNTPIKDL